MEQARDNGYKLHRERFCLGVRKYIFFFYSKNNPSLEQPHQGCGGIPIPGGFQDATGQRYIGAPGLPSPTEGC